MYALHEKNNGHRWHSSFTDRWTLIDSDVNVPILPSHAGRTLSRST